MGEMVDEERNIAILIDEKIYPTSKAEQSKIYRHIIRLEKELDKIKQLEAKNKQLYKLLSEIYNEFKVEPYFRSTDRLNIVMWIKSICKQIKALEGK